MYVRQRGACKHALVTLFGQGGEYGVLPHGLQYILAHFAVYGNAAPPGQWLHMDVYLSVVAQGLKVASSVCRGGYGL